MFSRCNGSSPGIKRLERVGDHSPETSAEVKNEWRDASVSRYVFMVWRGAAVPVLLPCHLGEKIIAFVDADASYPVPLIAALCLLL